MPANQLAEAAVKVAASFIRAAYYTITVIVNSIEGVPQGGEEFRHFGLPVAVKVATGSVSLIYALRRNHYVRIARRYG